MRVLSENLIAIQNSHQITDFSPSVSIELTATSDDIDALGHMNNAVYVNWLDQAQLVHTFSLGITPEVMKSTHCALVVRHTDLLYLAALREDETATIGTCITACDGKLRLQRRFQMVRRKDGLTLLRGEIEYVAIDFRKGRPRRMPGIFADILTKAIVEQEQKTV